MLPLERAELLYRHFSLNFITDLPPVIEGKRTLDSILVIVDRFSKFVRYIPCSKTIAATDLTDLF